MILLRDVLNGSQQIANSTTKLLNLIATQVRTQPKEETHCKL